MSGLPDEDEQPYWASAFDAQDEIELDPPLLPKAARPAETDLHHPLLLPLSHAQNAVARLEASVATASPAIAEGIRARIAYREAAGWLAHVSAWIHPNDLALRDSGLTGSYIAACKNDRLRAQLPSMAATGTVPDVIYSEQYIAAALRFAQLWRRLAELRTWRPLADINAVRETLTSLAWRHRPPEEADMQQWLGQILGRNSLPDLVLA